MNADQAIPHETSLDANGQSDSITLLTTRGPLLTKVWQADGTIKGHDQAKHHTVKEYPVTDIRSLADVLRRYQARAKSCAIRGRYVGDTRAAQVPDTLKERKVGYVLRQSKYFDDPAHFYLMFDVDGYRPILADPVLEPEEAIREWIKFCLPPEYHDVTFYWQLSSSAGHPSKKGELRAHVWFWTDQPMTSPEARAYVTMARLPVDRAPFQVVQAHYIADPKMEEGVVDPVPVRAGLVGGSRDVVALRIDEDALAAEVAKVRSHTPGEIDPDVVDPRTKRGYVGAFCRAFSVEEVLMADWFNGNFEHVSDRRLTWHDGNGAAEGAYVTDDGLKLVNTHNTAPQDTIGKGLNAWDLVRVYNFGELDEAVPEADRWTWAADPTSRPSDQAMKAWAKTLPEVREELDKADDANSPFTEAVVAAACTSASTPPAADPWGKVLFKKITQTLYMRGLTDDEIERVLDAKALRAAWNTCFFVPNSQRLFLMNKAGDMAQFPQARWAKAVQTTFGKFLVPEVLSEVSKRIAAELSIKEAELRQELVDVVWKQFEHHMVVYRQRNELRVEVDIFADRPSVTIEPTQAAIIYTHSPFKIVDTGVTPDIDAAIVAEYKKFFPEFDDFMGLMLYARFASDRRQAYVWLNCPSSWGKGLLMDGVLGRDGLNATCEMSTKEIERAFEGAPVGTSPTEMRNAWAIVTDEVKSIKSENKQMNSRISLAAKNQLRTTIEVYCKVFMSAEGIPSLAGSSGVEFQFIERFSLIQGTGAVGDLPLFQLHGKHTYRRVLANYVAEMWNAGVARMRAMGRDEATRLADAWVEDFHNRYRIDKTFGSLTDNLPLLASELRDYITGWALRMTGETSKQPLDTLKRDLKDALAQSVSTFLGGRYASEAKNSPARMISVRRLDTLVRTWIRCSHDPSQVPMLLHKAGEIASLVAGHDLTGIVTRHYEREEDGTLQAVTVKGGALLTLHTAEEMAAGAQFGNIVEFPVR